MLEISFIRDNEPLVRAAIRDKRVAVDLDRLLALDVKRRELITETERLRARRNELSKRMPRIAPSERPPLVKEAKEVSSAISALEAQATTVKREYGELMLQMPNVPAPGVPVGDGEGDNVVLRRWSEPPRFEFDPRDHLTLASRHGLVELEATRQFAGSRGYALFGDLALLEQAALQFALRHVHAKGFTPVSPPVMVKESSMIGTGFFPIGRADTYALERDGLFLVGTSEVSLVSLYAGKTVALDQLPIRLAGISTCFRREAGSAGRDVRGLYRVHQFQKVEQVVLCADDDAQAEQEHAALLANSEQILQALELPHRVSLACTVELGLGQIRKHEVETWMPSRESYSETHSCSSLGTFQARRSKIRYRGHDGRSHFAQTLNNTAIASPRILIPLLEHNQHADGTVSIPPVLQPFMDGRKLIG